MRMKKKSRGTLVAPGWFRFGLFLALLGVLLLTISAASIARAKEIDGGVEPIQPGTPAAPGIVGRTYDGEKVKPAAYDGDVRQLPRIPSRPKIELDLQEPPGIKRPPSGPVAPEAPDIVSGQMPGPLQNFAGLSHNDSCTGGQCGAGWPPDPNGDVGPNHYIEAVNSAFAIYSKTGTLLASFTENSLFSGGPTGTVCDTDSDGDPVVLYDRLADRWILTNFAFTLDTKGNPQSPFYECIAVSKTSNPVTGGWWLYALRMDPGGAGQPPVGALNDYPKFGVWTDCLYMAANEFSGNSFIGTSYASLSRSDLYSGAALTWSLGLISNTTDPFTMIPSNLLGNSPGALPPAGTPNYFVSESQTTFAFEVRKFTAGANCGGGGTLSSATNVSQASYTVPKGSIVPQPGTSTSLDSLGDRLMQKVQYRKAGSAESLWVVHTFRSSSSGPTGSQWAQLDVTGGTIATTPVQQQKYNPADGLYRWMGSIAADKQGDMALGYSTSNGTSPNFPSIAYAGRLVTDTLNQLPQSETQLVAGAGSQTNTCGGAACTRWGDYSAMSIDPVDDCTFWYINEYYSSQTNGTSGNWQTRIGSFKFPSCTASTSPDLTAVKTNNVGGTVSLGGSWTWQIAVANSGNAAANFTNGQVILTDTLPNNGISYGTVAVTLTNVAGTINCGINSSILSCRANGSVSVAAINGGFNVAFSATPGTTGTFVNPRDGGSCAVDPDNNVSESNESNNTCSDSVTVNDTTITGLTAANSSPTTLGRTTAFTASVTGGSNIAYTWNFGDGVLGSGSTTTHLYAAAGHYTARMTATNSINTVFTTTPVTITNLPPIANAGANQTVTVGSVVTLNGSASTDPDGQLPLTYKWAQTGGTAVVLSNRTLSVTTFTAPGSPAVLTFTLTVTDARGLAGATPAQTVVTVQDTPIVGLTAIDSSPTPWTETTTFTATISAGSNVTYRWDFGDASAVAFGDIVTHRYGSFGNFTAIVTATNVGSTMRATTPVIIVAPNRVFLPLMRKN